MTIASVAVDEAVSASVINQIIANMNSSPNAVVFTSNGLWSVPNGVHKFRVTMCGGGGSGGPEGFVNAGEDGYATVGGQGGDSLARRIWVSGVELGTSYAITIGAGGATGESGSATSFGALLTVGGGGVGAIGSNVSNLVVAAKGSVGVVTGGTLTASVLTVDNKSAAIYDSPGNYARGFGEGGIGTDAPGAPGIVIIEW